MFMTLCIKYVLVMEGEYRVSGTNFGLFNAARSYRLSLEWGRRERHESEGRGGVIMGEDTKSKCGRGGGW